MWLGRRILYRTDIVYTFMLTFLFVYDFTLLFSYTSLLYTFLSASFTYFSVFILFLFYKYATLWWTLNCSLAHHIIADGDVIQYLYLWLLGWWQLSWAMWRVQSLLARISRGGFFCLDGYGFYLVLCSRCFLLLYCNLLPNLFNE
jgi:hypothetical protein